MTTILLQSNITDLCRSKGRKLHLKCVIVLVGPKCGNILILRLDHLWNKSMHIHTYTHTHKYTQTDTHARARARARLYIPLLLSPNCTFFPFIYCSPSYRFTFRFCFYFNVFFQCLLLSFTCQWRNKPKKTYK